MYTYTHTYICIYNGYLEEEKNKEKKVGVQFFLT